MKATKKKRTIPYVQVRLKVDAEMGGIYDRMMRTSPRLRAREVIGMMRVADAVESPSLAAASALLSQVFHARGTVPAPHPGLKPEPAPAPAPAGATPDIRVDDLAGVGGY